MRRSLLSIVLLGLLLAGCGIFKPVKKPSLTLGERIPVLSYETRTEAEPELADLAVVLPGPEANADWPQAGGSAAKTGGHLALPDTTLRPAWRSSIGKGSNGQRRLNAPPVVMGGKVFTIDTAGEVRAFVAETGAVAWKAAIRLETTITTKKNKKKKKKYNSNAAFGGGVAAEAIGEGGRLYATTGYGIVAAFDAPSGKELWRRQLPTPLRGAPSVAAGRLYVVSQDNQLNALSGETGEVLWTVTGTVEVAGLLGAAAPAVGLDTIVVGFSSGELNALRGENGRSVWTDQLARTGRATAISALSDIDASPVIDRGRVFAIGHGGRMAAIDLATGQRVWERNFAGTSTPWVAGEFLFLVTVEGEVVCVTRSDGKVRWVTRLPRWKNPKKKDGPLSWQGPVLASEKLILTGSNGQMTALNPYTGKELPRIKIGGAAYLPPVVAGRTLYTLTEDGTLTAWR
ncbi:hypothetical protein IP88_13240 [alpha proteobacterium AAP81b]|nr:hypothetical protein IP88_13240 [alpha proteobacterium AAP81b]